MLRIFLFGGLELYAGAAAIGSFESRKSRALLAYLGFMVLYAIRTEAMSNGYDVKDSKYKAAAGEGATRQEHELLFNLTKPGGGA